jgi:flagellar biosynthesis anti-sigma factor FlgM
MKGNGRSIALEQGPQAARALRLDGPAAALADDSADASASAREVALLRLGVRGLDGVRAERVRALRAEIDAGRYRIDPRLVARALLREVVAELIG